MPDISMCKNNICPSKESCYRFIATPNNFLQSYADFKVPEGESKCNYYWNIYGGKVEGEYKDE